MRIRTEFPHKVTQIEHVWIPLSDGARLSARLWLPQDAESHPVPAILEYTPYRKDDHTAHQDSRRHPYFAGFGFASVRVDIRGTGDSDGVLLGEYLEQEQRDAVEVIEWLASQPWCTGNVGMIGYSWGGFAGLQVAALRPPALKAVVSVDSTDDRYADDCHYMGGCVLGSDMARWATTMQAAAVMPPDPAVVGDSWKDAWIERLGSVPVLLEQWLAHQTRDEFWRHGSVAESYADLTTPTLLVGGWGDAYMNSIPRLLENVSAPCIGIIGPWEHGIPAPGRPGPQIGILQEFVAWFSHWLKGTRNGVQRQPKLRAYMQTWDQPARTYRERSGRWVAEPVWPPANPALRAFALCADHVLRDADTVTKTEETLNVPTYLMCGEASGVWCANGLQEESPAEQSRDDARSLVFDSGQLDEPLDVLGVPTVRLRLSSDRPQALVAARLEDVAPDGSSLLVSWGLLNLTHRTSDRRPSPLEPGVPADVSVPMRAVGHRFEKGHRLRLALSPSYWPHAWPSPELVNLSIFVGGPSYMCVPLRDTARADHAPVFEELEVAPPLPSGTETPVERTRVIEHNGAVCSITDRTHLSRIVPSTGTRLDSEMLDVWAIDGGDPLSAVAYHSRDSRSAREGWSWRLTVECELRATATEFEGELMIVAYRGSQRVFHSLREFTVPRNMV